jgi:tRNA-binding protein
MSEVTFEDWKKLQLKVGQIREVERVPKTKKLYKLQVDLGGERLVQIVTSLVPYYTEEELQGRKIVVLTNLQPTTFAGHLSEAMLLCSETEDGSACVLLTVDKDIAVGSPIT